MANINTYGFPFNSVAGDRQYSATEWRTYFGSLCRDGVVYGKDDDLIVTQSDTPARTVKVGLGAILIQGAMLENDGIKTLNFTANTSGNDRIDRVIARLDYDNRLIEFSVLEGTPASTPTAPSLVRTSTYYDLSLARVYLTNNYSTIINSNITDERNDIDVCGYITFTADEKLDKIKTGTNAKSYAYTRTQTSGTTATQGSLEIESTPTLSSNNLISSGGVYNALANLDGLVTLKETGETIEAAQLVKLINDKVYRLNTQGYEPTIFEGSTTDVIKIAEIDSNKFLVCYVNSDNSGKGTACVLTVSNGVVTAGTPVTFTSVQINTDLSVAKLNTDKAIIAYSPLSGGAKANVLTISGTTITVGGSPVQITQAPTSAASSFSMVQLDTDKSLLVFNDSGTSYLSVRVLSVSGTTITAGNILVINTNCISAKLSKEDTNYTLLVYREAASHSLVSTILSINGTTVTKSTLTTLSAKFTTYIAISRIATHKFLISYNDYDKSNRGTAAVINIDVSLGTISLETPTVFEPDQTDYISLAPVDTNVFLTSYQNTDNKNYATSCMLKIHENVVKFVHPALSEVTSITYNSVAQLSTGTVIMAYKDTFNANVGKAKVLVPGLGTGYSLTEQISSISVDGRSDDINLCPYTTVV